MSLANFKPKIVRFDMYSSLIFVPKLILLAYFLNFGVLISKKIGAIFFNHVFSRHFGFQNGGQFCLFFLLLNGSTNVENYFSSFLGGQFRRTGASIE